MAEYIEREAALEAIMGQPPDAHYPDWYAKDIKKIPAADVVSKSLYDQIKWERDIAISQLESYGVGLGEKADVVEVVRCKDCKHFEHNFENDTYCRCVGGLTDPENNDFCSYGERKDNEC